jgi:tetratricopeptide (TPR) repeat protein
LVSTTLYIVQREAVLAATFALLGLLAYLHGRSLHRQGQGRVGTAWMLGGIGAGAVLATLCKANGALLPVLAWVLEATVLRDQRRDIGWNRLRFVLLVLPSILLLTWLASQLLDIRVQPGIRPWTIGQRLLTEPRVLCDYLFLLLVPRALSTGLFNDSYTVSTAVFDPPVTVAAIGVVLILVWLAFALRRRAPTWSAALLFFFVGHLLESTVIPLELYYEHRNYLPAILLFWPPAVALWEWRAASPSTRIAVGVAALALYGIITYQRAMLWGQPEHMALLWAQRNPDSPRAQAAAAMAELKVGKPRRALARLEPLLRKQPYELQWSLNRIDAACASGGISSADIAATSNALRHARDGQELATYWLGRAINRAFPPSCRGLDVSALHQWLQAAAHNPAMQRPDSRQDLEMLSGRLALEQHDADGALGHFNRALALRPTPGAAAQQAALLGSKGYARHALAHLDQYDHVASDRIRVSGWNMPRLHEWILERQDYWPRELARLRTTLDADVHAHALGRGAITEEDPPK